MTLINPDKILYVAATKLTVPFEGTILHAYQDIKGIWTIGTGSTFDLNGNRVTAATPPITDAQNIVLLTREMGTALADVGRFVHVPVGINQAASLLDFAFNDGDGSFERSTVLALLNAGNTAGAADHLLDWNRCGGIVCPGLVRRCVARRTLFLTPDAQ